MVTDRVFQWLLDLRSPLPRGVCTIELLGYVRIRGTVRRRWAFVEITSQEPGNEGHRTLHGPAAFFSILEMTKEQLTRLDSDKQRHRTRQAEESRKAAYHAERMAADAPKYTHSSCGSTTTWCGVPVIGLTVLDEGYNCPHCKAKDDDIPF